MKKSQFKSLLTSLQLMSLTLALPAAAQSTPLLQDSGERPTIIFLMVDGTRPDVLEHMASLGELPNIKRNFLEGGSVMENSFTSLSLTVPSWSTILTGMDIDKTGIKGNDVFDRSSKTIENFLDIRKEIIYEKYRNHGRAYRTVREAGIPLVIDRFNRGNRTDAEGYVVDSFGDDSEVFMTLFPLADAFPLSLFQTLPDNLLNFDFWKAFSGHDALMNLFFNYTSASALDRDSMEQALSVIENEQGRKKKFIGIYLQTVDTLSHHEHARGRRSLREVDYQVGQLFKTLQASSRYKNSVVILMSDHGSLGGEEYEIDNFYNPLRGENYALTITNLSHLFSGWYNKPGFADYAFNVEAAIASEGKFSLRNLTELQLQPFQCTNVARPLFSILNTCADFHTDRPEFINASVLSTQTVSLPFEAFDSSDWTTPNNWYTLTHFTVNRKTDGTPVIRNLVQDFEDFTLDNLLVFDSKLATKIGNHPLDWLALSIDKNQLNRSASAHQLGVQSDEDVVLIHQSASSEALVLRTKNQAGETLFRYVPISGFQQDAKGNVSFEPGKVSDPLQYMSNPYAARGWTTDSAWFAAFHTDREWTARYSHTAFPNTVPALTRFMSFQGKIQRNQSRLRADIYLNPRYGHSFAINNENYEATHGMWQRESVRNLFMATGPGIRKGIRVQAPAFGIDIVPTALKAAGYSADWKQFDGKAMEDALEH